MQKATRSFLFLAFLALTQISFAQDDLDKYMTRLKISEAVDGSETTPMSSGSFFLYGQGYFENRNYIAAAHFFKDALRKDPGNACASYQLGICLLRQDATAQSEQAQKYLDKAFTVYPSLKERFAKENAIATESATVAGRVKGGKGTFPR